MKYKHLLKKETTDDKEIAIMILPTYILINIGTLIIYRKKCGTFIWSLVHSI